MVEPLYNTATVKAWLNRLDDILYPRRGRRFNDVRVRGGNRPYDGVTHGQLTGIMLKQAIEALPEPLQRIVHIRWVLHYPLSETLHTLNMTKDQYYYVCDKIVESITLYLNGQIEEFSRVVHKYRSACLGTCSGGAFG